MTVSEMLQHAKARFECLAEEFDKAGDTASWAMCSTDAEIMGRAIAALSDQTETIRACARSTLIGFQTELGDRNIEFICGQIARKATMGELPDQAGGEPYLVWSNQHRAWWRPKSNGYTSDVRLAGRYSRAVAIGISGSGCTGWTEPKEIPDELAIPLSALPKNIRVLIAPPPSSTAGEVG